MSKLSAKSESPPGSPENATSSTNTNTSSKIGEFECDHVKDCETWKTPEFIFGGPFIPVHRKEPGIFLSTPYNTELSGFYRGTKAEESLKKDIPRLIETLQAEITKGNTGEEYNRYWSFMEDLNYNISTNKEYSKFDNSYVDSKMWNDALDEQECKLPLINRFGFSEAYAHTKIKEAMDLLPGKSGFDYHAVAKMGMLNEPGCEEAMYVAASRFLEKVPPGGAIAEEQETLSAEEDKKRKEEFISLIQFCLWSCKNNKKIVTGNADAIALDPFQFIDHNKTNIICDESAKVYDGIINRVKVMRKTIETSAATANPVKMTCSCHRLAKGAGIPVCEHKEGKVKEEKHEDGDTEKEKEAAVEMKICPTKVTAPRSLTFDIICEQSGLELFSVMCLAHFLIARNMVEKVRFHVKKIPWYETHATVNDITLVMSSESYLVICCIFNDLSGNFENLLNTIEKSLIEFCKNSNFAKPVPPLPPPIPVVSDKNRKGKGKKAASKAVPPPPPPPPPPVEEIPEPTSNEPPQLLLSILGQKWSDFISEGKFIIASDPFWVSPYTYKQMKTKAWYLYRSLQLNGIGAMFIGDVNYRRLLNEMRVPEGLSLEDALQGFNPAPIIAVRNINCEVLCGLSGGGKKKKKKKKKKKNEAVSVAVNPAWFETDNFGVIQYYGKADTSKHIERPCAHYGIECLGGEAQLVQVGIKKAVASGAGVVEGGDEAMLNVCTFPDKDNLCD